MSPGVSRGVRAASGAAPFNAAAFKSQFRAACIRRGVDPAAGATSYQAAAARADLNSADQRRRQRDEAQWAGGAWWAEPDLWLYDAPYHSDVEALALLRVFLAAYSIALARWRREVAHSYA